MIVATNASVSVFTHRRSRMAPMSKRESLIVLQIPIITLQCITSGIFRAFALGLQYLSTIFHLVGCNGISSRLPFFSLSLFLSLSLYVCMYLYMVLFIILRPLFPYYMHTYPFAFIVSFFFVFVFSFFYRVAASIALFAPRSTMAAACSTAGPHTHTRPESERKEKQRKGGKSILMCPVCLTACVARSRTVRCFFVSVFVRHSHTFCFCCCCFPAGSFNSPQLSLCVLFVCFCLCSSLLPRRCYPPRHRAILRPPSPHPSERLQK
ncbi:hypothetical protein TCSYLVIO_008921 [Trypanosoma cruzi]|nr:hypothetical protein TCSYLVIO_008921 [Trypanosoma cruzi]